MTKVRIEIMKQALSSLLILLAITPLAQAHHSRGYYQAKVVDATPIYRYKTVKAPREVCYHDRSKRRKYDKDAVVAGSIVGGALGYAAGNKGHKGLTALAGVVLGGAVAKELTDEHPKGHAYCETHYKREKVRVLKGYDVTYRHRGRIYSTYREDYPGKRIRIYY
jgi:uncharacterized protein YcfJ